MLDEVRKRKLFAILAHQRFGQWMRTCVMHPDELQDQNGLRGPDRGRGKNDGAGDVHR